MEPATNEAFSKTDRFQLVGTEFAGKFRLRRVVAEGGFGIVYEGLHVDLEVPIALKLLKPPPQLRPENLDAFFETFRLEARTMARLKHPNIVQVLDSGVVELPDGGWLPWTAMEWLEGKLLSQHFRGLRGQPQLPSRCLELLGPVLDALAYAHDEGIAHRDIKPANIILVEGRRGLVPKVLDFGIAKLMGEDEAAGTGHTRTQQNVTSFSPDYAAPEQVSRARTGPWTDVHALGLLLTELLIGRRPYSGGDMHQLFADVFNRERPTPGRFGQQVGPWEEILRKACAYTPSDRYASAGMLLQALRSTVSEADAAVTLQANKPEGTIVFAPPEGFRTGPTQNTTGPAVSQSSESEPEPGRPSLEPSGHTGNLRTTSGLSRSLPPAPPSTKRSRAVGIAAVVTLALGASFGAFFVLRGRGTEASSPVQTTVAAHAPRPTRVVPEQIPALPTVVPSATLPNAGAIEANPAPVGTTERPETVARTDSTAVSTTPAIPAGTSPRRANPRSSGPVSTSTSTSTGAGSSSGSTARGGARGHTSASSAAAGLY